MKKIIFLSLIIILFSCCDNIKNISKSGFYILNLEKVDSLVKQQMEYAYFEGQKDAINGDVRIEQLNDTQYIWTKSCWDGKIDLPKPDTITVTP